VAPAGGGGVLELLVAVVAVVLAQRHPSSPPAFSPLFGCSLPSLPYFKRTFRLQASLQSGISQEFCDFSHDLSLLNSLFLNSQSNLFIVI
jgi:hypothetical protein